MSPKLPDAFSPEARKREQLDYLLDMLEQLAAYARKIGERDVALHIKATTDARRLRIEAHRRSAT